jgi:hypothetical protein
MRPLVAASTSFEMEIVMRLRFWRHFGLAASAAALSVLASAVAYGAWSHHPTSVKSSSSTPPTPVNGGGTTTTTTTTIPSDFTGTIVLGTSKTIHAYLAGGNGLLGVGKATFLVTSASPPTSSTTTTTVFANQNGSTTTTNTTVVVAAAPQVTTTTLANPPPTTSQTSIQVNIPGFGPTTVSKPVVTLSPQAPVNGVTATNLVVTGTITGPVALAISPGSRSVPFSLTETVQTVAVAPVAPITTTASSTILPPTSSFPRGAFGALAQPEQPEQLASDDVEAEVKAASDRAQAAIALCGIETPSCVADALEAYADVIEKLAPQLPPRLQTLPAIIRKAAQNIRVAKTPAAAARAVKLAIAEVHKTIALLRADDAAARQSGTRDGALIVQTLQVASNKLEKAVGL